MQIRIWTSVSIESMTTALVLRNMTLAMRLIVNKKRGITLCICLNGLNVLIRQLRNCLHAEE